MMMTLSNLLFFLLSNIKVMSEQASFELGDISNFREVSDLAYIFFGILTVDVLVLFLTRYYKVGGKYLNEWYDKFDLLAVLADVMIILIGFIIARYLYTIYFYEKFGWSPIYFMVLLVAVQLIHDVLFYYAVIKPIPEGHNQMMDTFKRYAEDLGGKVLGGDALLMIFSALFAMIYKSISVDKFYTINALVVYALPYILFTRNPYDVLTTEVKKEK
jgi:uncharacterized protein YacL